jgi:hypothetical protein
MERWHRGGPDASASEGLEEYGTSSRFEGADILAIAKDETLLSTQRSICTDFHACRVRFHAVWTAGEQLSVDFSEICSTIMLLPMTTCGILMPRARRPSIPSRLAAGQRRTRCEAVFDAGEQVWSLIETNIRPATTPSAILLSRGNSTARACGLARCSASRSEKGE